MELSRAKIEATASLDMRAGPGGGVLVLPIGDIHYGTPDAKEERLRRYIDWGLRHDAWFLGMGDYFDFSSPSNRARLRAAETHDNVRRFIDEQIMELKDRLVSRVLTSTRGRWLGMVRGHHFWITEGNEHTDQALATELGAPYLGTCGIIGLRFREGICNIWIHHGKGYGATMGAPLNHLQRLSAGVDAHVYLMGHQHKLVAAKPQRIVVNWRGKQRVRDIDLVLACTGSWMAAYTEGRTFGGRPEGSYAEERALLPAALGGLVLDIMPQKEDGMFIPDVRVTL